MTVTAFHIYYSQLYVGSLFFVADKVFLCQPLGLDYFQQSSPNTSNIIFYNFFAEKVQE